MAAISPNRHRIKIALQSFGWTVKDLAKAIGRSPETVVNVLNGNFKSRPTRQLLTDFFGFKIWDGVEPSPSFLSIKLPAGTKLAVPTPEYAAAIAPHFGAESASAAGEIVFPGPVFVHLSQPAKPRAKRP
jgi:transcriptional regulator with XRE-family HTH domain